MRKRLGLIFVMVLLVGLVVSPAYAQTPRIGLIFAEGGLGDQSFNDAAYRGDRKSVV